MIKILQKYGKIKKFDFLYHKSGPVAGKPRGYCFVTYEQTEDAHKALTNLDGKFALGRKLTVRHAHEKDLQVLCKDCQNDKNLLSRLKWVNLEVNIVYIFVL